MRKVFLFSSTAQVEASPQFCILSEAQLILSKQVVAGGQVKNRPADVGLAHPHLVDDSVHVVHLKEPIELLLCNVLQHGRAFQILLLEHHLDLARPVHVLQHGDQLLLDP